MIDQQMHARGARGGRDGACICWFNHDSDDSDDDPDDSDDDPDDSDDDPDDSDDDPDDSDDDSDDSDDDSDDDDSISSPCWIGRYPLISPSVHIPVIDNWLIID